MRMGKLLLVIMFVMVLVGDSVLPAGEDNSCPNPDNPNNLQCSNTTIEGKDGGTVILPCSTKDEMDISHKQVEWLFRDSNTGKCKDVHLYHQGENYLQEQSDDFKNQLSSGRFSLSLNVTTAHNGTYYSIVGGQLCCTVTLIVPPAGGDNSSQIHQEVTVSPDKPNNGTDGPTQNNWTIGSIVGVVGFALIGLGIYNNRKQLKNCFSTDRSGMKPKNGQIYHGVPVQAQQPPQDEEKKPLDQNPTEEQTPMEVVVHQGH